MKIYKIFLPLFIVLTIITSIISPIFINADSISDKVLRLHILANSDSTYDQNIKLELKEYFLDNSKDIFTGNTIDENIDIAKEKIDYINELCDKFLEKYGFTSKVTVCEEFFKTRVYDDFTLPAGVYNAIKIEIGQGKGHNWWCIVFPSVCLSACSESMQDYLTDDEMELINSGYSPKFKLIEIYERIKNETKGL